MTDMLDRLHKDHINMSRLLALLGKQATVIERGERGDLRLLSDILFYITHYPDLYHHTREDFVFETLRRRDPQSAGPVEELLAQHKQMTEAAMELTNDLAAFGGSIVIPRERLVGLLRDYVALSCRHMDVEESQVFPRARAVLNAEDWQEIEKGMTIEDDPLFGRVISEQYRSLYDTIVREAAADTT